MKKIGFPGICSVILIVVVFVVVPFVRAYELAEFRWPQPSITMHVDIPGEGGLWDTAFGDAMSLWNSRTIFQFRRVRENADPCSAPNVSGERKNGVGFSDTLCGIDWGRRTLATSRSWHDSGVRIQNGVIFNNTRQWDVYSGPYRAGGLRDFDDFRRVAVHELGHVIGLSHEDDVPSIMATSVSIGSTIELPLGDDIQGVAALYEGSHRTNDLFSEALTVSGRMGQTTGNNAGAGRESGEPGQGNRSVWWKWRAPENGTATIDTIGSSFDTTLGVYTGSRVDDLNTIAENDDAAGLQSRVVVAVTRGTEYRLRVAGYGGASGDIVLNWDLRSEIPLTNDLFSEALTISGRMGQTTGNNAGAGRESGEPGQGNRSVWWKWRAPENGTATIDTVGSNFDTTLGVYTGSRVDDLNTIAENDDAAGLQSRVVVAVTRGTEYRLRVAGYGGASGDIVLNWDLRSEIPLTNDLFSEALTISGRMGQTTGNNAEAGRESGEPGQGDRSVWWKWRAPGSGTATIDTVGSNFDTTLGVYTGSRVDDLNTIAENDDGAGLQSRVVVAVTRGTEYRLRVAGYGGASGDIVLNWDLRSEIPLTNDLFSEALTISGRMGQTTGNNAEAGRESGEPGQGDRSVWWKWRAPGSGTATIDTVGSNFDTTLGVYTGSRVDDLNLIAENDDGAGRQSRVVVAVTRGTEYRLRVAGYGGASGDIVLNWDLRSEIPLTNDLFSEALTISGRMGQTTGNNAEAGRESGEPGQGDRSVWWKWRAPGSGTATIDTVGSNFDTTLGVYTGSRVDDLNLIAENDDGAGRQSRVVVAVTRGTEYRLRVAGYGDNSGDIVLNWDLRSEIPLTNDLFSEALTISGRMGQTTGNNAEAGRESGEPGQGDRSVWWKWRAPGSGTATIDTVGSNFDTTLGVYTGSRVDDLNLIAENDDGAGRQSRVVVAVTRGTEYRLRVAGYGDNSGDIVLNWDLRSEIPLTNDLFSEALTISGRMGQTTGNNAEAGRESGEPGQGDRSVWWKWRAPGSGTATIDTVGSNFDTTLGVYTGSRVDDLNLIAENDDGAGRQSRVVVAVTRGTEYRLRVAGYGDNSGDIVLNWDLRSEIPLTNDLFSEALTISGRMGQTTGNNAEAGRESGEPGQGDRSVWWKWRAPGSGTATIDTVGSNFDTTLGVYTGSRVDDLNLIAENDDGAGRQSRVVVAVTRGTEYRLRVAGYGDNSGDIVLNWDLRSEIPLTNDLFSEALTISGRMGQTTGNNAEAGRESGEPGQGDRSVWWKWRAPGSGTATIDTVGSNFDTTLGVYTGSRVDDLNLIAENDDGAGRQSRVVVAVTRGTEYRLRVAGYGDNSGDIVLNWDLRSEIPLTNDLFSEALTISGRMGQTTGNNAEAGRESGEPGQGDRSVWWKWRAPGSGTATIDTVGSNFDTTLGVYTGSRVDDLNLIAENDDGAGRQSRVVVAVTRGTEYRLRVAGYGDNSGDIVLNWDLRSEIPLTNDLFSEALTISGRMGQTTGNNAEAGRESGEPGQGDRSVWWKWRAPGSGTATIDTVGSNFDTTLGVYTGSRVDDLNLIAENDDGAGRQSRVVVAVTRGTEYRLRVAGYGDNSGDIVLNWDLRSEIPLTNDLFSEALTISGRMGQTTGNNAEAGRESGEPGQGDRSVWWKWRAPGSGTATIDTVGSNFDTTLGVYTGSRVDDLNLIAENDDGAGRQSRVVVAVTRGTEYRLRVAGYGDNSGDIVLNWDLRSEIPLTNDLFSEALTISGRMGQTTGNNAEAGRESGEPGQGDRSVWWKWRAPGSGTATIDTVGSNFDTTLGVYTGSRVDDLNLIAENDDGAGRQSRVVVAVTRGTEYRLRVAGYGDNSGDIVLNWDLRSEIPLTNDLFSEALTISGRMGQTTGNNAEAGRESGEPGQGDRSVWWKWRAPGSGTATIDTVGSNFDTTLGVYTGSRVDDLNLIAENDDGAGRQSRVVVAVTRGTEYRLRVAGYGDNSGDIVLNWDLRSEIPLTNDLFSDALTISGQMGQTTGHNAEAGRESGEPGQGDRSVWWKWRAPGSGTATIDTVGSNFDTTLGVYTGSRVDDLNLIAENDDGAGRQSRVVVAVTRGTEYRLRVAGFGDNSGDIVLNWNLEPVNGLTNDLFSEARTISGRMGQTTGSNAGAGRESGEPGQGDRSVWWKWRAPRSGTATIDTVGSNFDTTLGVYTGSRVDDLNLIVENDDGAGRQSRVVVGVTRGTEYRLRVAGFGDNSGDIVLNWDLRSVGHEPNDRFSDARTISGQMGQTTGHNAEAGRESGEPGQGDRSVWWKWRVRQSGTATIDTIGSNFDTTLGVYTGSRVDDLNLIAENDDAAGRQSRVVVEVTRGTEYRLRVAGFGDASGDIILNWNTDLGLISPSSTVNDLFSEALTISGLSGQTTGNNAEAGEESGEPGLGSRSVWWNWRAPQSGTATIDTIGSSFDTTLGVYTGSRVDALNTIAEDHGAPGRQSSLVLKVTAGTEYRLRVAGYKGATGDIVLNWNLGTRISRRLFVPIVLRSRGYAGSFFTSELTLTNRGTTTADIEYTFTTSPGGVKGTGVDFLEAGQQYLIPDAIAYLTTLASLGVPTGGGSVAGTLVVDFSNLSSTSDASATVRVSTLVDEGRGRAGLSYMGLNSDGLLTGPAFITGLRQNSMDRSNVAVQNAGDPSGGKITLRVTVFSGNPESPGILMLPDLSLAPGGFHQYNGILNIAGFENGYVKVERVSGKAPYYAYGVINDQVNSDGSFVFPVREDSLTGTRGQTLPVIIESGNFKSELTLTNFSALEKTIDFSFVADAIQTDDHGTSFSIRLKAGEQIILPDIVEELRQQDVAGIGPANLTFVGALFATVAEGDMRGIVIGARTGSPDRNGGQYSLFYNAVPNGLASSESAWIYGLQQNEENRSNLALVNTGEIDDSPSTFEIDIYDGSGGSEPRTIFRTVGARRWHQVNGILGRIRQGYVQVRKTSGNNPFVTYGVINDGGSPGQRSGDGAFLPSHP